MSDQERELRTALEEELSSRDWGGASSVVIDRLTVELEEWNGDAVSAAREIAGRIISTAGGEASK
jgi:hypothetical protein